MLKKIADASLCAPLISVDVAMLMALEEAHSPSAFTPTVIPDLMQISRALNDCSSTSVVLQYNQCLVINMYIPDMYVFLEISSCIPTDTTGSNTQMIPKGVCELTVMPYHA
jgi:hypothetical protein